MSYRTGKVERGSLQAAVSASGTVNPVLQVIVGTQVSCQVKELFADFNSVVKKGALIARIDPETFQYRLRQSEAAKHHQQPFRVSQSKPARTAVQAR